VKKRELTLEEQVMRDLRRARRWESVHVGYGTMVSIVIALVWCVLMVVREYRIWR
jgi:hypothetical protein